MAYVKLPANQAFKQSLAALDKDLAKIKKNLGTRLRSGMAKVAYQILKKSNSYVPVDTGFLRGSGHSYTRGTGDKIQAEVMYNAEYAIYVHEDLTANHPHGGQAKFLERAVKETQPEIAGILKKTLDDLSR
jgi:hypothetical protein